MAITGFPYVSVEGDRKVTAANEATRIDLIAGSGVIFDEPTSFACAKISDMMQVTVQPGSALIAGHGIMSDAVETVTIEAADLNNPRIDIIALESNSNTGIRGGRVVVVKGIAATTPIEPALVTTAGISQIKLATLLIPATATTFAPATLTDARTKGTGKHTHPSLTSVNITEAIAPGTARVANIVFGTGNAPTIDSTMPQGTIYIKYLP